MLRSRIILGWVVVALSILGTTACGGQVIEGDGERISTEHSAVVSDEEWMRRSLAITDLDVLDKFSLKAVLDQIIDSSGVSISARDLFNQFWDIQNERTLSSIPGPHCDDEMRHNGGTDPTFNGFKLECPRAEGNDAFIDPFQPEIFKPVGIFNRFDLAPADGTTCGKYRIIFAREFSNQPGFPQTLINFEAVLPNPNRNRGLEGCRPVVEFWADLKNDGHPASVALKLRKFFFVGLPGFPPAIRAAHYGGSLSSTTGSANGGQIRTNQFAAGPWTLREFRIVSDCRCNDNCRLLAVPATTKQNPEGLLFDSRNADPVSPTFDPRALSFQNHFISQLPQLGAAQDPNEFSYRVREEHLSGEGVNSPGSRHDYRSRADAGFKARVAGSYSALSADQLINRALALSCAGCHRLSGGTDVGISETWPSGTNFTHIQSTKDAGLGPNHRFDLSPVLKTWFLPYRLEKLKDFLATRYRQPRTLADLGPYKLPPGLLPHSDDCSTSDPIPKLLTREWPWEQLETLRIDFGPRLNRGGFGH